MPRYLIQDDAWRLTQSHSVFKMFADSTKQSHCSALRSFQRFCLFAHNANPIGNISTSNGITTRSNFCLIHVETIMDWY